MDSIFGEDVAGELYSVRNGLILSAQMEKAFDNGQLSIVPSKLEPNEYELRVMDKGILKRAIPELNCTFFEVHGRKLQFLNNNRPRRRFLYFHWIMCLIMSRINMMN